MTCCRDICQATFNLSDDHARTSKCGLSIGNLNVRSLAPSADLVADYVKRHHLDIMCFTETWLRRGEPNVPIANLTLGSRTDRTRNRGGVAIYIVAAICLSVSLMVLKCPTLGVLN